MSQQLKITVPLPPSGSGYLKVFEEFFTAQVPSEQLVALKEGFLSLRKEVDNNIYFLQNKLRTSRSPLEVHSTLCQMRAEAKRISHFMDNTPLPPSLDEIAGAVILDNYFLSSEDGGIVVAEMKAVCLRRYKAAFPNADRDSLLRTQELLDNVFKSVDEFYVENSPSHTYMKSLAEHYYTFIPSLVTLSSMGGLDIYMEVDGEPPKLTAEEAKAMEENMVGMG